MLFSGQYVVVASKLVREQETWFGNMVLVSMALTTLYDFVDLRKADYYSHFLDRFSSKRPLAVAVMYEKGTPLRPKMMLCSAHSAHKKKWDLHHTTVTLTKIVCETIDYYSGLLNNATVDFSDMGVLFGGDLNTTEQKPVQVGRCCPTRRVRYAFHPFQGSL